MLLLLQVLPFLLLLLLPFLSFETRLLDSLFFYFHGIYVYIYIFEVRKKEGRSVSGRRCGLVDERYHPVMVYLNQSSGSLLGWVKKRKKEEKKLVRPASLV